jgi:hypothetical protein
MSYRLEEGGLAVTQEPATATEPSRPGLLARLGAVFAIDVRSLAALRIGLALVVLCDLAIRVQDLERFYADSGVLPRADMLALDPSPNYLSLHLISGRWEVQALLFLAAAVFGVMLLVGYRTRLATAASWLLLISLQARNPLVNHAGDVVLRLLLFWSMFLPLGACLSLDRLRDTSGSPLPRAVCSPASAALLLQVALLYFFTGLLKDHPIWRSEGSAVWYALSLEEFSTEFGRHLLDYPSLLTFLTFATIGLELIGPFLPFVPFWNAGFRLIAVTMFVGFHLGLLVSMRLGIFPYVCWVAWLPFLPGRFWDFVLKRWPARMPTHLQPHLERWRCALRPTALQVRTRFWALADWTVLCLLLLVVLWNLRTVSWDYWARWFPPKYNAILELPRLDQCWNMFAPYPLREDGWYVLEAKLRDGSVVDLATGSGVTDAKPPLISATYPNERVQKYMLNLWLKENHPARLPCLRYACRRWDSRQKTPQRCVESVTLHYWLKFNTYGEPARLEKVMLEKFTP